MTAERYPTYMSLPPSLPNLLPTNSLSPQPWQIEEIKALFYNEVLRHPQAIGFAV